MGRRKKAKAEVPMQVDPETPVISVPSVFMSDDSHIRMAGIEWARECGMKGKIDVVAVKKHDYGWQMTICDERGRMAEARFTNDAQRNMWEMTSR